MKNIEVFVKKLRKYEGGKIHKNKNESDITTSCGIYRKQHPNASIFKYIDSLAESIGITSPSSTWTKEQIEKVNDIIDMDIENKYTEEFYRDYIKSIDLDRLPLNIAWCYYNIYVTGNKLANKSLQRSCNFMLEKYPTIFNNEDVTFLKQLDVDGIIGKGSREAIYRISDLITSYKDAVVFEEIWKQSFISFCKSYYIDIATGDVKETGTDKDIIYLKGWKNRCDELLKETL